LFSGTLYDVDQKTIEYIKNLWDVRGLPIILIRFCTTMSDMGLFNKTIVELSKEFENADKTKYSGMAKEAENLYKKALSGE
jgi:hypothetical protein